MPALFARVKSRFYQVHKATRLAADGVPPPYAAIQSFELHVILAVDLSPGKLLSRDEATGVDSVTADVEVAGDVPLPSDKLIRPTGMAAGVAGTIFSAEIEDETFDWDQLAERGNVHVVNDLLGEQKELRYWMSWVCGFPGRAFTPSCRN
ncbi:MAG: hypothetical protein CMJ81_13045 [Planctomycetaceae bacterium]|nr:hypothetical protein [Planctomycetaceae bacterium]